MSGAGRARAVQINNLKKCPRGPRFELGFESPVEELRWRKAGEGHSGECLCRINLREPCQVRFTAAEMLPRDDLFLSRFSILSLLLVFFSFIRACLGLGHPAVYRMNGFSLKIHVTCFRATAAFFLQILSCLSCSLLLKCVLFCFSEFVF